MLMEKMVLTEKTALMEKTVLTEKMVLLVQEGHLEITDLTGLLVLRENQVLAEHQEQMVSMVQPVQQDQLDHLVRIVFKQTIINYISKRP